MENVLFQTIGFTAILGALGLWLIFARDINWQLTHWNNRIEGVRSERTELWDAWQIISGVALVLFAAVTMCFGVSHQREIDAEAAAMSTTASAELAALQSAFGPHLAEWEQAAGERDLVSADIDLVGLRPNAEIIYGRCATGDFYVYIKGYPSAADVYAYIPGSSPTYCKPDHLYLTSNYNLGEGWYSVQMMFLQDSLLPTPAPVVRL